MSNVKGKLPISLQVRILERFLKEKELMGLYDSYKEARLKFRRSREATPTDRKVFKEFQAGASIKELMKSYGRSRGFILYSIALASRE